MLMSGLKKETVKSRNQQLNFQLSIKELNLQCKILESNITTRFLIYFISRYFFGLIFLITILSTIYELKLKAGRNKSEFIFLLFI